MDGLNGRDATPAGKKYASPQRIFMRTHLAPSAASRPRVCCVSVVFDWSYDDLATLRRNSAVTGA